MGPSPPPGFDPQIIQYMVSGYTDYTISLFSASGIANTEMYIENILTQTKSSVLISALKTQAMNL